MDNDEPEEEKYDDDDFDGSIMEQQNIAEQQPLNGTFPIAACRQESSGAVSSVNRSILMNVDVVPPMDRYLSCSTMEHNNNNYSLPTSFAEGSCQQCSCRCCRCCSTSLNLQLPPNPGPVPLPDLVMITSEFTNQLNPTTTTTINDNQLIMNTSNTTNCSIQPIPANTVSNINHQPQSHQPNINNNRIKSCNTLPYINNNNNNNNNSYNSLRWSYLTVLNHLVNFHHLNRFEENRRLLPLNQIDIQTIARQLRQMADEFSRRNRQVC